MTSRFVSLRRIAALSMTMTIGLAAQTPSPPALPDVLSAAAAYVTGYERSIAVIACEERYQQQVAVGSYGGRVLRSDIVLINGGSAGWIQMRDVFEVDGNSIRPRDDRLLKLLSGPQPDALDQARRLASEGVRYHLGRVNRAINTLTTALRFVRADNQYRSVFTFGGLKTVDGLPVALVAFKERTVPPLLRLRDGDDAVAEGRFWIDPLTGRVVQTELALKSTGNLAKIGVKYADQPKLGLWLPARMDEEYALAGEQPVTGRADYREFRKIEIDVSRIIRQP